MKIKGLENQPTNDRTPDLTSRLLELQRLDPPPNADSGREKGSAAARLIEVAHCEAWLDSKAVMKYFIDFILNICMSTLRSDRVSTAFIGHQFCLER